MKYWLLTTEYPPLHGGGISTYCYLTAQMLAGAGYAVTVITQDEAVADHIISTDADNIRLVRFNSNRDGLHQSLGYTARLSYAFAGVVQLLIEAEGKPAFIEAQDYLGIAYYLIQFKHTGYDFLSGVPIVLTLHSPAFIYLDYNRVPTYRFPDFWTGEMEKQSIVAADHLISPTHFLIAEIEKYISLKDKIVSVISNPYTITANNRAAFQRNKIVYYGKLSRQKGSFKLLEYFKALWDDGFAHPLHIIGDTDIVYHPEMKTMGQLVKERYAPYLSEGLLQLHGKIKPAAINNYLQDAHVVIVPSIVDNMPYVVMEAMSLSRVVLASTQGGQREMIADGISGFLFDHDKPGNFATQLIKILSLTDELVEKIGHAAREKIAADYSFEKIAAQKTAVLKQVKNNPAADNHFPFLYQEKIQQPEAVSVSPGLLSVVIPYFNMGSYIEECLQSIQNSSYQPIEILIINDGSNSKASIDKLKKLGAFANTKIIDQPNQGLAATRNNGASIAQGEYLAFLDADDKVAVAYFTKAITAISRNDNVFFAGAWVKYFEDSGATWPTFTPQPPYALVHNTINSSSLVYKRTAFLAGGVNDARVDYGLEDYGSMLQLLSNGFNGVVLPEILFYYRVRKGSMIRNITTEKLLYSNKYIAEKHNLFYAKFAIQIINLLNANGPGHLFDNPTFAVNVSTRMMTENRLFFKFKNFIKKNGQLKRLALSLKKLLPHL